ncbi:hypothetical protein PSHT_00228, partial [Puccinia striiformis]
MNRTRTACRPLLKRRSFFPQTIILPNWLTPDHHLLTRRACNLCAHRIKIELNTQNVCCGVNQLDVDKLKGELSIIQVNFQLLFLPASSQIIVNLNSGNLTINVYVIDLLLKSLFYLLQRSGTLFAPSFLRFGVLTDCNAVFYISLIEHTWIVKITVYHRPCLPVAELINPSSPQKSGVSPSQQPKLFDPNHKSIQRVLQQRRYLNMLFGDNFKKDAGRAQVEKNIKSTIRSKLRRVKVPPRIGALHFS